MDAFSSTITRTSATYITKTLEQQMMVNASTQQQREGAMMPSTK
jgi:hypothetical protein